MNHLFKRITVCVAIGGAGMLVLAFGCYAVGVRINTTSSIPLGIYLTNSKSVEKGDYVFFCPPQVDVFDEAKHRGYISAGVCPGNYGYMMKRVLAAKNDAVSVADDGVRVSANLLPFSKLLKVDKAGRRLLTYEPNQYILGDDEVLLMSDVSPISFDSRYFGPINRSQIKSVISPVISW
jgi:conjugative transfer signal peptidase TraF